jgi:hypothetical protein
MSSKPTTNQLIQRINESLDAGESWKIQEDPGAPGFFRIEVETTNGPRILNGSFDANELHAYLTGMLFGIALGKQEVQR